MGSDDSVIGQILSQASILREKELADLRAERNRQPFVIPGFRETDAESYATCISLTAALKRFQLSTTELAITQLHRELKSGRIEAVCHQAISFIDGAKLHFSHAVLDTWIWHLDLPTAESDFWETGYFRVLVPETLGRTSWRGDIELFQVRVWPDGLPGGADNPLQLDAPIGPPSVQTPLPKAEAERVAKAILQIWTHSVTETRALALARGLCPDHKVSRDPFLEVFRAIRGAKKPGIPASNGN